MKLHRAWDLPFELSAVNAAREGVSTAAAEWRLGVDIDTLALVTDELVLNALEHGRPPVLLELTFDERGLEVAVTDAEASVPFRRLVPPDTDKGRGVAIVEAFTEEWGVTYLGSRKRVWAYVPSAHAPPSWGGG